MKYTLLIISLVLIGWLFENLFPGHIFIIRTITVIAIVLSGIIRIVLIIKNKKTYVLPEYDIKNKVSVFDELIGFIKEYNRLITSKQKHIPSGKTTLIQIKIDKATKTWKIYTDNPENVIIVPEEDRRRMRDFRFIINCLCKNYNVSPVFPNIENAVNTLLENEIDIDCLVLLTHNGQNVLKLNIQFG